MMPLFEVQPVPKPKKDKPQKTPDQHLEDTVERIAEKWGCDQECYADLTNIKLDPVSGLTHRIEFFHAKADQFGLLAVPVYRFSRPMDERDATVKIANMRKRLCIRLDLKDFENYARLKTKFDYLIQSDLNHFKMSRIDIIIDLEESPPDVSSSLERIAADSLKNLPYLWDWRSITLTGSAFPKTIRQIQTNTFDVIERAEWKIWQNLIKGQVLERLPRFGDYGVDAPGIIEDLPFIDPLFNIRYTTDAGWLVYRGKQYGKGDGGEDSPIACKELMTRPEYCGEQFSWGDGYIKDCAVGVGGPGNAETWRRVGTNHHLRVVVRQLANFSLT